MVPVYMFVATKKQTQLFPMSRSGSDINVYDSDVVCARLHAATPAVSMTSLSDVSL